MFSREHFIHPSLVLRRYQNSPIPLWGITLLQMKRTIQEDGTFQKLKMTKRLRPALKCRCAELQSGRTYMFFVFLLFFSSAVSLETG